MDTTLPPNQRQGLTLKALLLNGMQWICLVCWVAQLLIDNSHDNLIPVTLVVASTSLVLQYLRLSPAMTTQPLSSFALLGFTASSQFVALAVQTTDLAPFVQYLRAPTLTFTTLAITHCVVVLAHFVYRNFTPLSDSSSFIARKLLSPLNIHRIPTPAAIWLLASVGILSSLFGGGGFGDVGGKFLAGFVFLTWIPYLIPIYINIVGPTYCNPRRQYALLFIHTGVIIILAMIKNGRAMLFLAPIQLTFLYIIESCRAPKPLSRRVAAGLVISAITGVMVMPSLSDMVTAMEISRAKRDKASPTEMIQETFEAFIDKTRIQQYREASRGRFIYTPYDETYLSNPLFSRFTETKFHDNMIYLGSLFDESERDMLIKNQIGKIQAIFPQNIYDLLEIKFQKEDYAYSNGDFYLYLGQGVNFGGYATGSIWADMYVIFGIWFPVFLFALMTVVFILMDANSRFGPGYFISPIALCTMWHLYLYGIGGESIAVKISQIIRGTIQPVALYALVVFAVYALLNLFQRQAFVPLGEPRTGTPPQPVHAN